MPSLFKRGERYRLVIHAFFILVCLIYVLPMLLIVSISFSSEKSIMSLSAGYSIIPREFSLESYQLAFANDRSIIDGYIVTTSQAFLGTFLTMVVVGMVAYPLSRSQFAYKKPVTFIIFFTMLFSGGMIPTYIIYTTWYNLGNNFLIYILPGLAGGAWNTLIVRTFFKGLPESLFESAKIDGARELTIFFRIAVPLSKPVFATIGFMTLVAKWNDWMTSMIYIRPDQSHLYTLQYLLQRVLQEAQFLRSLMQSHPIPGIDMTKFSLPAETLKYAMCVIAAGPMLVVFPFFQKYFASGLTVGAIKG